MHYIKQISCFLALGLAVVSSHGVGLEGEKAALLARDELAAGNPNLETRFINPLIGAKLNARQDPPAETEPADPPEEPEAADPPEEPEAADPPEEPEEADPPEETEEADQPEETEGGDNEGAASHPVIALTTMASIVLVSSVMILA